MSDIKIDDELLPFLLQKTKGGSGAFIKELMRRAAQFFNESGALTLVSLPSWKRNRRSENTGRIWDPSCAWTVWASSSPRPAITAILFPAPLPRGLAFPRTR